MAFLLCPVWSAATVLSLPYNVRTVLDLNDGDTIMLNNFPQGWNYSRIVMGINSSPSLQLSGDLIINGCKYKLDSYYRQLAFEYSVSTLIKYSGSPQRLPIQWWVDNSVDYSVCRPDEGEQTIDSVTRMNNERLDSIIAAKEMNYVNLDSLNGNYVFSGSEAFFKVSSLPNFPYNAIYIQIEPLDGSELDGGFYAGLKGVNLSGWTETIVVQKRTRLNPTFELAFPTNRTVKLKWWVGTEDMPLTDVSASEISLSEDSVRAVYSFGRTSGFKEEKRFAVLYDRRLFVDRKIPRIKGSQILPLNISALYETGDLVGNVYELEANNIPGAVIQVAIPLAFEYHDDRDSVYIAHFLESENRWEKIAVDSIVDNIAYFKTSSFSFFSDVWSSIEDGAEWIYDKYEWYEEKKTHFIKVIVNGIATAAVELTDGVVGLYKYYVSIVCGDWSSVTSTIDKKLFPNKWSVGQGSVPLFFKDSVFLGDKKLVERIRETANGDLKKINSINDYSDKWKATSENLDIVLADLIYSRLDTSYSRRFSFYMSDDYRRTYFRDGPTNGQAKVFSDYFQTKDELIEDAMYLVDVLKGFYGVTNIDGSLFYEMSEAWGDIRSGDVTSACKEWLSGYGLIDRANDLVNLGVYLGDYAYVNWLSDQTPIEVIRKLEGLLKGEADFNPFSDLQSEKDEWLQKMTSAMLKISLLAWLDKSEFRPLSLINYVKVYNGMMTWLQLASPVYGYNNMSIKANAALALFEFIHYGTENNLKDMNKGMNRHYGGNGGFSEGMGYSQYIWDEVPYAIAVLQEAYAGKNKVLEVNENFLKSAEYVLEMSRPVKNIGLVPVEVDDGCTYNPDYLVWGKVYDKLGYKSLSSKYGAVSRKYPLMDAAKMLPMVVLGLPSIWNFKMEPEVRFINGQVYTYMKPVYEKKDFWNAYSNPDSVLNDGKKLWGSFKDGLGLITAVSADSDTVALSVIAENGGLWRNGQGHDQQDNLSITLSSSKKGFLIQDRGYKGYDERWDESIDVTHFYSHNRVAIQGDGSYCVSFGIDELCIDKSMELGNQLVDGSEISQKARDFSNSEIGAIWRIVPDLLIKVFYRFGANMDDFRSYGGTEADTLEFFNNASEKEIFIVTKHSSQRVNNRDSVITNIRTIMYYGGGFWVIDRPSVKGALWMINSPKKSWDSLVQEGVRLYGSGTAYATEGFNIWVDSLFIQQEGKRADYSEDVLSMRHFVLRDTNAWTYVMNYGVDNFNMEKTEASCPDQNQCFENPDGSKRLVVVPYGQETGVSSVVKNMKLPAKVNGILLANRNGNQWNLKSIGGYITVPSGDKTNRLVTSGNEYYYTDLNGGYHSEKLDAYLPHIPLLLLK